MGLYVELQSGLVVPVEPPKDVPSEPEPVKPPITPLVDKPFGHNPDGSFTLCPEVMELFTVLMKRRGQRGIAIHEDPMSELADAIYKHQRVDWEQWT